MMYGARGGSLGGCVSKCMLLLVMNSKVDIKKTIGR